jgi:hypothetical protein
VRVLQLLLGLLVLVVEFFQGDALLKGPALVVAFHKFGHFVVVPLNFGGQV